MKHVFALLLAVTTAFAVRVVAAPSVNDANLSVTPVVTGLNIPIAMAFIGTNDFLFLEKNTGRVRRVTDGVLQTNVVLDLVVEACDERGLLGIAVHPDFPTTPHVYLFHTLPLNGLDTECAGDPASNRVSRFEWNSGTLTNPVTMYEFPVYAFVTYHNGGALTFGPDGKLYAVTGDQEQFCDLQNFSCFGAYDDTSVIVRLNDDGSIPNDNPFFAEGGKLTAYYAYGIRNSFGMAFDPVSGKLWDTENGENDYDEINLVEPGFNSGWRELMGPDARSGGSASNLVVIPGSQYADPQFSWLDVVAPTGITFVDSTALGATYENDLFVGDYNNGRVYRFDLNAQRDALVLSGNLADRVADGSGELGPVTFATGFSAISDLKTGPDGKLYVVDIGAGAIYVISGGAGEEPVHDLAVVSIKPPKKITLSETKTNQTKAVKVTIQNLGNHDETINDLDTLTNTVVFAIESLGGCPVPATALVPPKKGFPVVLGPKKKLNLSYNVTFDCANDPLSGATYEDYRYTVTVDHSALDGNDDDTPENDDCPREPSGADKGCGNKDPVTKQLGADVLTDVAVK